MHICSKTDSTMLTEPPSTIETTLALMLKELCEKRKPTDHPPPKLGSKVGDHDQVLSSMHQHYCLIPYIAWRRMTVGARISNRNQHRLCVEQTIQKEQTHHGPPPEELTRNSSLKTMPCPASLTTPLCTNAAIQ
jgi:hypothetical protein